MKSFTPLVLALAMPSAVLAQQTTVDERIVIIGESMQSPSEWVVDAKKPRQPLPAHDAGDFLKSLAGFSSTRKGF
jgi:iron complex outermembrane receptor protein